MSAGLPLDLTWASSVTVSGREFDEFHSGSANVFPLEVEHLSPVPASLVHRTPAIPPVNRLGDRITP